MKEQNYYYVMPADWFERVEYPTLELVEWLAQPRKSFKKACRIADDLARKGIHNGRIIDRYAVVKAAEEDDEYTFGIYFFQTKYEIVYEATCEGPRPFNVTSLWESHRCPAMVKKHGQSYFDMYVEWVQDMSKSRDGYSIAQFADCISAARFLKKEWANGEEIFLTVQKNGQRINLSNQMFRFGNVIGAQSIAQEQGHNPAYYTWYVGEQAFPSYGDAVVFCLENAEYDFDDITKKKNIAKK